MPVVDLGPSRNIRYEDDAGRAPRRVPLQPAQPQYGAPQARTPQQQQNAYADRQSAHGTVYTYIPAEYKNLAPTNEQMPEPFSQDHIKIPYSNLQRAGRHNERPAVRAPATVGASTVPNISQSQMDRMRADYENKQNETRGRARERSDRDRPSQPQGASSGRSGKRARSNSLGRFKNWIERKLTGESTKALGTVGSRPATPASQKQSPPQPAQQPTQTRPSKPPVSTGVRESPAKRMEKRAEQPVTSAAKPPPIPSRPVNYVPTPLPGNPTAFVPSKQLTKQKPAPIYTGVTSQPSSKQNSPIAPSKPAHGHTKKPSASDLLHKVAHPLHRRQSDVSELSFFCSGVEDDALEVKSKKRADIIAKQKQDRADFEARNSREAAERRSDDSVFERARREQREQEQKEKEAELERRLRESMYGTKAAPPSRLAPAPRPKRDASEKCVTCEMNPPMTNLDVCSRCADKHQSLAIGQDLSNFTGPKVDPRHASVASTIYGVDLSNYAGGPFARPPSSIYPTEELRPVSGYTIGNPYSDKREKTAPPPMPALPEGYKVGPKEGHETRDTAFYEPINAVHREYYNSAPNTPKTPKKSAKGWKSARESGMY